MMKVKFIGGHQNGVVTEANMIGNRVQPILYLHLPISIEDHEKLKIDEFQSWKAPEEVYQYDPTTHTYIYQKTVHYKP
jgi:hypothetical protein